MMHPGPWLRRAWRLLPCLLLVVPLSFVLSWHGARADGEWSAPVVVFRTDGYATRPRLVADSAGDLHLFFFLREASVEGAAAPTMIMYSRLHDGTWSVPVDVLVGAGTNSPTVAVDQQGILHVAWEGGPKGELMYSRAHASVAGSARAWSQPRQVSEPGAFDSDLEAPDDGTLRLVYSTRSGNVWYRESGDGGTTWSPPVTISEPQATGCTTNNPQVAVDSASVVHVVWTELQLPNGWPPCGAQYSDSLNRGRTWSSPVRIAGPGYGQINVLAADPSTLLLAWNAMVGIGERKFTRSIDGGFGWQSPQDLSLKLRGGFTGLPSLAADSAGVIHLVTAVDRPRGESMAVYHLAWNGVAWSEPVLVSVGAIGARSVELPWITVSHGNRLHVIYEDDFQRMWYTTRSVSAPPVPARPVPAPNRPEDGASRESGGTPTTVPTAPLRAPAELPEIGDTPLPDRGSVLIGLAPVAVIVGLVVVGRLLQRLRE